ncbi:MAG: tartrate dehydrogenase [Planctomycetes bacterium]|nr:tartrate dehydrogenase [Planctomycetota bacterium]MBL7145851.1 tartrate dehydrogenase [Phycisphaerae bacterium]
MNKYKIAVVPGDGIGPEIVPAGVNVLNAAAERFGFYLKYEEFPYGAGYYKQTGTFMPDDALNVLKGFDAIYFGAVGLPDVDDTLPAKMFTFKIRTSFDQYVNYRPARLLPGIEGPLRNKTPNDIDFVVIRENTEGEFVQSGGFVRPEFAEGMATDTSIFTRKGIERIAHYSFQLAKRRRKLVTNVTKSNTLIHSLAYWDRIVEQVSTDYPDVEYRKMYVDNASANFVLAPEKFDVIVTTNFIGDILSDLGGAIMGSLGLGPSGNINPEKIYPSMFEPIHGSAPDIAGKGIANPIGAVWSAGLMLEHLGQQEAAQTIVRAIEMTVAQGVLPVDLGGSGGTVEITNAIVKNLKSAAKDNAPSN